MALDQLTSRLKMMELSRIYAHNAPDSTHPKYVAAQAALTDAWNSMTPAQKKTHREQVRDAISHRMPEAIRESVAASLDAQIALDPEVQ